MATSGKSKQVQKLQQVVAAIGTYLPGKVNLMLAGKSVKIADFLATLNAAISADAGVTAAQAQLTSARSTRQSALAVANTGVVALKQYLIVTFGPKALLLSAFGFAPKTRATPTPATLAIAAAQRKLTRQVRGTKGVKQKRLVTTAGKPGLVMVAADGTPLPGLVQGPVAPAVVPDASASVAATVSKPPTAG